MAITAAAAVVAACQTTPNFPNKPLATGAFNVPPVVVAPSNPDDPFILLAFSGGGSRATALAMSVLDELRTYSYRGRAGSVRLVDRVRAVSSVSGGSVAAAWFGLVGPDGMDVIQDRFLTKDNMATLVWTAADPITWARLTFSGYTRIDALRDLLDTELFDGKRFAELARPNAPLIVLNATDMGGNEVFTFTAQHFNDICSDLGVLPISVGVASSAAFPVALSPMSLINYSGQGCVGAIPREGWVEEDLKKVGPRYLNLEEFKRARYVNALRHGADAYRRIDYVHLLDGGLVDNQGVHSLLDTVISPHGPLNLINAINHGDVKRIVVIAVNARSDPDPGTETQASVPGVFPVLNTVVGAPIDSTTAYANASLQLLVDTLNQSGADARKASGDPLFKELKVYGIPVDFDQFHNDQNALRDRVKAIGTSWSLSSSELGDVALAGRLLLDQHPCFQRLLQDLNIKAPFVDPSVVQFCPVAGDPQ